MNQVQTWVTWNHELEERWEATVNFLVSELQTNKRIKGEMGGALYHGPEVAPEEFPEQEEEPGGEVSFDKQIIRN